jgi:hypothetical protein
MYIFLADESLHNTHIAWLLVAKKMGRKEKHKKININEEKKTSTTTTCGMNE